MPFSAISRDSLELLNQNYRLPGVMPRPVPPGRGAAASPQDPDFSVADELIRAVPFMEIGSAGRPHARQYQVRVSGALAEPDFSARAQSSAWVSGATTPAGTEFELTGTRFKKLSTMVRTDELMVSDDGEEDVFNAQLVLAQTSIVRALSEALLFSSPASDEDAEFTGLPFFLPTGNPNNVAYDSTRGLIGGLSELECRVAPSDGDYGDRPDVFVLSSRARWRLIKELEDKGVTPEFVNSPLTGRLQFHLHGVPVLIGRVPEPSSEDTTEAWALKLYGPSGIRVLHAEGDPNNFGLRSEPITTVTQLDATGEAENASRGVEVFGVYAVSVPEPNAIARLQGIPAADPFTVP